MNGKDILLGLKYVGDDLIEKAEYGQFPARAGKTEKKGNSRRSIRRPLLIAAIIATMLLLVGCAVAYVLSIQNMKVGDDHYVTPVFDEYNEYQGDVTVPQQILTLAGIKGTPSYQAAQEWFEFKKSYDPQWEIQESLRGNYPDFSSEYDAYEPYSQEMVDKIDEIVKKYGLKLAGSPVTLHGGRRFYQEMGIDSLLVPGSQAKIDLESASGYEGGSFTINLFFMEMPSGNGQWPYRMTNCMFFSKKDCFNPYTASIGESDWTQWNYTTASGYPVLLMRCDGFGWIICDREDATISVRVELSREEGFNEDGKSWTQTVYMTDRQFEMVADAFDFSMNPRYQSAVQSFDGVDPQNPVQTQNGYTMELKSAVSDGHRAIVTLGITAPKDVSLTRLGIPGYEDQVPQLTFSNEFFEVLTPQPGGRAAGSGTWYTEDDGDDLENTQNVVIEMLLNSEEGAAFVPGSVWTLYWEDLQATYWNSSKNQQDTLWSVEGNWMFEITFDEGDFRELEMIQEPITAKTVCGWDAKGNDVYEETRITSFLLRSLSATISCDMEDAAPDFLTNRERCISVVLKDGSRIPLHGSSASPGKQNLTADSPIALDQADYVLLSDGTKLPATNTQ